MKIQFEKIVLLISVQLKKKIFLSALIFTFSIAGISCVYAGDESGNLSIDKEQQQLHLCFIYSNLLGFNISTISNPKLYQSIAEWLGTPYKYSGSSKKGIDCSGLICQVFHDSYDKQMDGCAGDLYKKSDPVKKEDLKEGDLVFFKIRSKRITHVGIYLGENRFVHASSRNGVIVSNLEDSYYKRYFYKAGRIKSD